MSVPTSTPTSTPASPSREYPSGGARSRAPLASTSLDLLDRSRASLLQACRTGDAGERYVEAHLGALRAAAALLAARSMPSGAGPSGAGRSGRSGGAGGAGGSGAGSSGAGASGAGRAIRASTTRSRPRSVWELLPRVAPELTEWAAFFAASARRRAAIERGGRITGAGVRRPAAPGGEPPRDRPGPARPAAGHGTGADLPLRRTGVLVGSELGGGARSWDVTNPTGRHPRRPQPGRLLRRPVLLRRPWRGRGRRPG